MKKITKTTFKSFLKKNAGKLLIQINGDFDGMSDCVEYSPANQRKFIPLEKHVMEARDYTYGLEHGRTREEIEASVLNNKNTLGYRGVWLVNNSRDSFNAYDDGKFQGIEVYNCCGSFIVVIQKGVTS